MHFLHKPVLLLVFSFTNENVILSIADFFLTLSSSPQAYAIKFTFNTYQFYIFKKYVFSP